MITPFEHITNKRPNLSHFKTFGCRCYVRLPGRRSSKLENNVRKGIFIGYTATLRHIQYLDLDTGRLKNALHATFDEGMGDLDTLTPNSRQLRLALGRQLPKEEHDSPASSNLYLDVHSSPFLEFVEIDLPVT